LLASHLLLVLFVCKRFAADRAVLFVGRRFVADIAVLFVGMRFVADRTLLFVGMRFGADTVVLFACRVLRIEQYCLLPWSLLLLHIQTTDR
jgi:hypothetical protein